MMNEILRGEVRFSEIRSSDMRDLAEIIGVHRMFHIVWVFEGLRLYIPRKLRMPEPTKRNGGDLQELLTTIGQVHFFDFIMTFGGRYLQVPPSEIECAPEFFTRYIRENHDVLTTSQLAWKLDLSEQTVCRLLRQSNEQFPHITIMEDQQ